MEEARWMMEREVEPAIANDGNNRIGKATAVLKHHKALLRSKKCVQRNSEREEFVGKTTDWWNNQEIAKILRQKDKEQRPSGSLSAQPPRITIGKRVRGKNSFSQV